MIFDKLITTVQQVMTNLRTAETEDRISVILRAVCGMASLRYRVQTGSGAHQPSYEMGAVALTSEVKRPGLEADHLPPSSAEIKNTWS
jgi:hypothetical protein